MATIKPNSAATCKGVQSVRSDIASQRPDELMRCRQSKLRQPNEAPRPSG
jgi:hypothetical protein